jgi:hypothetical protein
MGWLRSKRAQWLLYGAWMVFLLVEIAQRRPGHAALYGGLMGALALLYWLAGEKGRDSMAVIFAPALGAFLLFVAMVFESVTVFVLLSGLVILAALVAWIRSRRAAPPVAQS